MRDENKEKRERDATEMEFSLFGVIAFLVLWIRHGQELDGFHHLFSINLTFTC